MAELTIKDDMINLNLAWNNVDGNIIGKCCRNILNFVEENFDPEDDIPSSGFSGENIYMFIYLTLI